MDQNLVDNKINIQNVFLDMSLFLRVYPKVLYISMFAKLCIWSLKCFSLKLKL